MLYDLGEEGGGLIYAAGSKARVAASLPRKVSVPTILP
jgi:hypothetical protein